MTTSKFLYDRTDKIIDRLDDFLHSPPTGDDNLACVDLLVDLKNHIKYLEGEIESYKKVVKDEYGKREALDEELSVLASKPSFWDHNERPVEPVTNEFGKRAETALIPIIEEWASKGYRLREIAEQLQMITWHLTSMRLLKTWVGKV